MRAQGPSRRLGSVGAIHARSLTAAFCGDLLVGVSVAVAGPAASWPRVVVPMPAAPANVPVGAASVARTATGGAQLDQWQIGQGWFCGGGAAEGLFSSQVVNRLLLVAGT